MKILVAGWYATSCGPRAASYGMYESQEQLNALKEKLKHYFEQTGFDANIVMSYDFDKFQENDVLIFEELRQKALEKYAQMHPNEMASEDEVRDYKEV